MKMNCILQIGLLAILVTGCGKGSSSAFVAPSTGAVVSPANDPATATLTYWNGLNSLPAQIAPEMNAGPQLQIKALRGAASVIRQNPTLGVDVELTTWAQRMATALEQRANLIENSRNPNLLAEAFLRGTQGDPFGVAIELNQAERLWLTDFQSLTREQGQLRVRLTARYRVEFPPP